MLLFTLVYYFTLYFYPSIFLSIYITGPCILLFYICVVSTCLMNPVSTCSIPGLCPLVYWSIYPLIYRCQYPPVLYLCCIHLSTGPCILLFYTCVVSTCLLDPVSSYSIPALYPLVYWSLYPSCYQEQE